MELLKQFEPIGFVTPNNFAHKAGDGLSTRKHNLAQIHPALQANCGGTQMTYLLEEYNEQETERNGIYGEWNRETSK